MSARNSSGVTSIESRLSPDVEEVWDPLNAENHLVAMIYRFANDPQQWFNLLTGVSQCLRYQPEGRATQLLPDIGRRLMPHFQQAISICTEMTSLEQSASQAQAGLDQLMIGIIVIDAQGRIVLMNARARTAVDQLHEVTVSDQRLWVTIDGRDVQYPLGYRCETVDWQLESVALNADGHHAVVLRAPQVAELGFPQAWQLTPAETRVASHLLIEQQADAIAQAMGCSVLTVRDHLASLYRKTGAQRKTELLQLLLASQLFHQHAEAPDSGKTDAQLPEMRLFRLADGRKMSYVVHGDLKQHVVVLCHNFMGSAFELPPNAYVRLKQLGLCVLVPERPGYGDSDFCPGFDHKTWCHDLAALLDSLNVNAFSLIGHSMGGNYALQACETLAQRVRHLSLVSPMVRYKDVQACAEHTTLTMRTTQMCIKFAPFLLKPMMQLMLRSDVEAFYDRKEEVFSPVPPGHATPQRRLYHLLEKPYFVANLKRAVKQGIDAWVAELALNFRPWHATPAPHIGISIWHGAQDDQVPLPMVEHMHRKLNAGDLTVLDEEGHGFLMRHIDAILEQHAAYCHAKV